MRNRLKMVGALAILAGSGLAAGCTGGGGPAGTQDPKYTIGGTVAGLAGGGLVLQNNGGNQVQVAAGAASFTFPGTVAAGTTYNVAVVTQPSAPSQACTVASASGTAMSNVTVAVACVTNTYTVGGTISGLSGGGLTLLLNGGGAIAVAAGATGFAFPALPSGTSYAVTVGTQPTGPAQVCSVANGSGSVGSANVTSVAITCVTQGFTLSGTVTGLSGSGLVLQNNGAGDLPVTAGATSFAFPGTINSGSAYAVTVKTQPSSPSQTCTVSNGAGTATANVLVAVSCVTNAFTIGGSVAGLSASGLTLLLDGGSPLAVPAGATGFVFPGTVAPGAGYAVTVGAQPAGQTCTVANGSGTVGNGNVTGVAVSCSSNPANSFTVGGSLSGLTAGGLVLLLNGGSPLAVASGSTSFAFAAVPNGTAYTVTVGTQPTGLTCSVSSGSGTVSGANVASVAVACAAVRYTIGGSITGLAGSGLQLQLNGGAKLTITAGVTTFTFAGTFATGTAYTAVVATQPTGPIQICSISNGSGTVGTANVGNIAVTCVAGFTIGGTITNQLANGMVLLLNGGTPLTVNVGQASFAFAAVPSGTPYTVTVGTQPTGPNQTCTVDAGASGTVAAANVTSVAVVCRTFGGLTIGGNITGYTGSGLTLKINGGPAQTPQSKGKFTFPSLYQQGDEFQVTIASQPTGPAQTCTLIRGAGAVPTVQPPQSVGNIAVQCTTNATSPLSGTYTVTVNGKGNFLTLWPDGTYTFATRLDDATCGSSNGNGIEYGVYTWNAATGAFAIVTAALDSNGGCGVWDNTVTPQAGASGTLVKNGNTLTLTTPDGSFVLTAVTSTPSALIGSFNGPDGNDGAFLVFLPDNTYLHVQTQAGLGGTGLQVGYERGCYTVSGSNLTFNLSASCLPDGAPALDLNGSAGASGTLGVPIPFLITGANTITLGGDTFLVRIVP